MRESSRAQSAGQPFTSWLDWAGQHPGFVLLGTLLVAALLTTGLPTQNQPTSDTSGEEDPLFI